jgi:signal peptidase I
LFGLYVFAFIDALYQGLTLKSAGLPRHSGSYVFLLLVLINGALGYAVVLTYHHKPYSMVGPSMEPTIFPGERFQVHMKYYERYPFERGDVVLCEFPEKPEKTLVKRVIGLPGDTVAIVDKQVFVNGELLREPYAIHSAGSHPKDNHGPVTVAAYEVFVLGDNRDHSVDSRFWRGPYTANVKGKVLYIFWSNDMSRIGMSVK